MPDNDRFRSGLSERWLRVQRSISAGEHSDRIADLVVKATAEDLRRLGGLTAAASRAGASEPRADSAGWFDTIQGEDTVSGRHYLTLLAVEELTQQWALTSPATALQAFAERVISNVTDDHLDRMLPYLLGPGKLTAAQFADLRDDVRRQPQMTRLRDQLAKHPDASGLRAPRRVARPRAIGDVLNTDLEDL